MKERKQCGNCVGIFSLLSDLSTVLGVALYGEEGEPVLYRQTQCKCPGPFSPLQMELNVVRVGLRVDLVNYKLSLCLGLNTQLG